MGMSLHLGLSQRIKCFMGQLHRIMAGNASLRAGRDVQGSSTTMYLWVSPMGPENRGERLWGEGAGWGGGCRSCARPGGCAPHRPGPTWAGPPHPGAPCTGSPATRARWMAQHAGGDGEHRDQRQEEGGDEVLPVRRRAVCLGAAADRGRPGPCWRTGNGRDSSSSHGKSSRTNKALTGAARTQVGLGRGGARQSHDQILRSGHLPRFLVGLCHSPTTGGDDNYTWSGKTRSVHDPSGLYCTNQQPSFPRINKSCILRACPGSRF